jgi:hypothetical protein
MHRAGGRAMTIMTSPAAAMLSEDLKTKLAPLLRMQASDNDGERANASAAITRLLKKSGLDWHDLTEVLLSSPQPQPQQSTRSTGPVNLPSEDLEELLDAIEQKLDLSPKTAGFIGSLRERTDDYEIVFLSAKQWKWLQDLVEAAGA